MLSLRQLRYFVSVIEYRGFTAASSVLHVAQPALSRQIAQLEESLGEQLLVRLPEGVQPTETGRRLYYLAREVLDRINGAEAELKGEAREPQGRVSVALPATCGAELVTDLIKTCTRDYPGIDLQVTDGISSHTGHVLSSGLVDFGVIPNAEEVDDVTTEPLFREQMFLIRAHDGRTRQPTEIEMAELSGLPIVIGPKAMHLRRFLEISAQTQGVPLNLRYEQRSVSTIAGFVRAGLAVTVSNWPSYIEFFPAGTAIAQRIVKPHLWRTISIGYPTARPLNHASRATYDLVKRLILQRVSEGAWRGDPILDLPVSGELF